MPLTRRAIVVTLAISGFVSVAAWAQKETRVPRIAFLSTQSSRDSPTTAAFLEGLRQLGYVEGHNIVIEWRWGGGSTERFQEFAAEVVRLDVDVIVAANDAAGRAAQQATRRIPIVIAIMSDPVGSGFAATLGRPGGNITGSMTQIADLTGKRLQLLNEAVPKATRIAFLVDTNDLSYRQAIKDAVAAARLLGLQMRIHEVGKPSELREALVSMSNEITEAVLVGGGTMLYANRERLAERALESHWPMMCQPGTCQAFGCLISYGARQTDRFRHAAYLVDKILRGASPSDLPIEQPTFFELVVNMKTAKSLGFAFPRPLLSRADQVLD